MTQTTKTDEAIQHIEQRFRSFDDSDQAAVLRYVDEVARDYDEVPA